MPDKLIIQNARIPSALVSDDVTSHARVEQDCLYGDLLCVDGVIRGFVQNNNITSAPKVDIKGQIILPLLVEPHCHLDKCYTVQRLGGVGGDLNHAIEVQFQDKLNWTEDDIYLRARKGLEELYVSGCGLVRTHIDWSSDRQNPEQAPVAWRVIEQLSEEYADQLQLERSPLLSLELFDNEDCVNAICRRISAKPNGCPSGAVLGVFLLGHNDVEQRLITVFKLAEKYNLKLDFHVDESLEKLNGLAQIAKTMLDLKFQGSVVCGHACALMNCHGSELKQTIDLVAESGLSVVALPSTNLYLQGRNQGTPDRRGMTRIKELVDARVNVAIGCDNVADAFCPIGKFDPMHSLSLAILAGHLDPPYDRWLCSITTIASKSLGHRPTFFDQAVLSDLLICNATNTSAVISGASRMRLQQYLRCESWESLKNPDFNQLTQQVL